MFLAEKKLHGVITTSQFVVLIIYDIYSDKKKGRMFLLQSRTSPPKNRSHLIANFSKTRLCPIFASLEFLLSVSKIVPMFILETMDVPIFTKGPSCIHNGNNDGFDAGDRTPNVTMCRGRSTATLKYSITDLKGTL